MASDFLSHLSKASCERKILHTTAMRTLQEQLTWTRIAKCQPSGKRWLTTLLCPTSTRLNYIASMAARCCLKRDRKRKDCADWVWKISKNQVHKHGCIRSAQRTSLGIHCPLYKNWLSLLYIASDWSAKSLWDLWQHPRSFQESTTPVAMCCVTPLWLIQRFLGVENSSLKLGMWEFTHHYLAVCKNALQE